MSWTAPRTWSTNEVVTSSLFNTHIRDNALALFHPYDYAAADVDATNTTAETSLYSKVITGGDLGSNGVALLQIEGDALRNNSPSDTLIYRVKFGGSTLLQVTDNFNNLGTSGARLPWVWRITVANRGSTSSQFLSAHFHSWNWNVALSPTTGIGGVTNSAERIGLLQNTASVDTTADQTLQFTVQWSAGTANNSWRRRYALLQLAQN